MEWLKEKRRARTKIAAVFVRPKTATGIRTNYRRPRWISIRLTKLPRGARFFYLIALRQRRTHAVTSVKNNINCSSVRNYVFGMVTDPIGSGLRRRFVIRVKAIRVVSAVSYGKLKGLVFFLCADDDRQISK